MGFFWHLIFSSFIFNISLNIGLLADSFAAAATRPQAHDKAHVGHCRVDDFPQ
jgi:hypothetical protein